MASTDTGLQPNGKGNDVVDEVLKSIKNLGFPDDKGFLKRIAIAESNCGLHKDTYRAGYSGGIWQVDKIGFESTQDTASHPGLKSKYATIKEKLGIDWTKVKWSDLTKPLYSGLAARLFLVSIPDPIPASLEDQARYWDKHYNKNPDPRTSAEKFIERVKEGEKK